MGTYQSALDKYLTECDLLVQSFKQNPKEFINNFDKKKNDNQADPGTYSSPGNNDEFTSFGSLKKMMIKLFLELKDEEDGDDYCKYLVKIESKIIEKLVNKLGLNYLILNLWPNNEGYSIGISRSLRQNGHNDESNEAPDNLETFKIPYEESELLDFIDNEELPPMLVDIFDTSASGASNSGESQHDYQLFYCGCMFVQVRDYRKNATNTANPHYESSFVRLKPTTRTIVNDVIRLTTNTHSKKWTAEERNALEAKLIYETSEPLCLDPNPMAAIISNRFDYEKKWLKSSKKLESLCKKNSQVTLNRVKVLETLPAPRGLELYDFLKSKNGRTSPTSRLNKKINNFYPNNKISIEPIDAKDIQVDKFAKKLDPTSEDSLAKSEEYIIEFVDLGGITSKIVITIYYRSIDDTYFGQVFSEKLYHLSKSGTPSMFMIGPKSSVKKYVDQFFEILNDKGRVSLRITHVIPGQAPRVMCTLNNDRDSNSMATGTTAADECSLPKKPKMMANKNGNKLNFINKLV